MKTGFGFFSFSGVLFRSFLCCCCSERPVFFLSYTKTIESVGRPENNIVVVSGMQRHC